MLVRGDFNRSFPHRALVGLPPPISDAVVLPLESSQGAISRRLLCSDEPIQVIPRQASSGIGSFLKDPDDRLLESNRLRLECVFCDN